MLEKYVQKGYEMLKEFNRVSPPLLMRRLKITGEMAQKVCNEIYLRQRAEARALATELENYGFDPQLQRVARKNLENFKGNKKKS